MSPWRAALLGGLLYGLPYGVWLLGGLEPAAGPLALGAAQTALIWTQALALGLLLPAVGGARLRSTAGAAVLLVAVPWPLVVLMALVAPPAHGELVWTQALMLILTLSAAGLWHLGGRAGSSWRRPLQSGVQALVLLGPVLGFGLGAAGGWL